eukprot:COSAG06_NODE_31089_length_527_cov_0.764019_1_plen_49_part_01
MLLCAGADWRKRDCDGRTAVGEAASFLPMLERFQNAIFLSFPYVCPEPV